MQFSHWTPVMQNPECPTQYSNDQFSILAKVRSMFHLSIQFFAAKKSLFIHFKFFTISDAACW